MVNIIPSLRKQLLKIRKLMKSPKLSTDLWLGRINVIWKNQLCNKLPKLSCFTILLVEIQQIS